MTASVTSDSSGATHLTAPFFPNGIPIFFGATGGTITPASAPTQSGSASSSFTSTPSDPSVSATLDNQTVSLTIEVSPPVVAVPVEPPVVEKLAAVRLPHPADDLRADLQHGARTGAGGGRGQLPAEPGFRAPARPRHPDQGGDLRPDHRHRRAPSRSPGLPVRPLPPGGQRLDADRRGRRHGAFAGWQGKWPAGERFRYDFREVDPRWSERSDLAPNAHRSTGPAQMRRTPSGTDRQHRPRRAGLTDSPCRP